MNRATVRVFTNVTFVLVVLAVMPAAFGASCSLAQAAGDWAFTLNGTLLTPSGPVPVGAVGLASADQDGTLTGSEARSVGGGFANETLSGSWSVNPDCTGTATVDFYEGQTKVRTSLLSIIFDKNSKEIRMVQQSLKLPDGTQVPVVVTASAARI